MADQDVSIVYQAVVSGTSDVEALAAANMELQATVGGYTNKVNEADQAQKKQTQGLVEAGREAAQLRRAFIGLLLPITADVAILNEMAKGSETIAASMEKTGDAMANFAGKVGNAIAFASRVYGGMSTGMSMDDAMRLAKKDMAETQSMKTTIERLNLEAKTAKELGDDETAMMLKQQAEQLSLKEKYHGDAYNILKKALDNEQAAETQAYQLSELGLKSHMQIMNDFQKNLVGGAFEGSTQSVLEKTLSGQHQTGTDVLQTFQSGIAKAVSEAVSQSLWTTLMQGGNFFDNLKNIFTGRTPAVIAAERAAKASEDIAKKNDDMLAVLHQIAECVCSTAQSLSKGFSMTTTPPETSGLQKAASIFGLVGSLGSLGNLGGLTGGTAGTPIDPTSVVNSSGANGSVSSINYYGGSSMSLPDGVKMANSSGNWVPSFPSGGEVQVSAQPGEFIVRRGVAQQNKDLLESLNNGGKPVKGTGNVFIINANDASSFAQMLTSPSAQNQIEIAIMKSIMSNGNLRNIIKNFAK